MRFLVLRRPRPFVPVVRAGLVFAGFLVAFSVRAEPSESELPISIRFDYRAPESCLDEDAAFSLVRRRSRRVARSEDETVLLVSMAVVREGMGYRGVLTVLRPGTGEERRMMAGANCDEVVEALALTAALSIDPEATVMLDPEAKVEGGDERAQPLAAEIPERAELGPTAAIREPAPLRATLSPFFAVGKLMTSGVHLGAGFGATLSRPSSRSFLPLEVAASVVVLFDAADAPEPTLRTDFLLSHFAYCPLRWGTEHALLLCPAAQLGVLLAESRGFEAPTAANRFFATIGLEARWRTRLSEEVELWVAPAVDIPLTRRSFAVEPGPEVLATTVDVGFRGWLGLGWSPP